MMKVNVEKEPLQEVIDQVVKKTLAMDLTWDWPCGVAYYGVTKAYEVTGKEEYLRQLKTWTQEYIDLGLPNWNVNTCAMGHMLLTLYEESGDAKYWELIQSKLDYLKNHALRFGERVLQHTVADDNTFPEQAWADTLFMAVLFMLRVGVREKDEDLIQDALNQYVWHIRFLQDPKSGLWYHGYSHVQKGNLSGFHWGRANAWAAYTMSCVKKLLVDWYLYPQCMEIECALRDQLAGLKSLQSEDGLWRTLLDDEGSYEEVSASAGIAAAMVNNGNILHSKYVQKAFEGVLENITQDGRVMNVSGGTAVMKNREGYCNIPRNWIQGWGQGLALTFLST
ncbi:MAG: glycoside hydrolase family 88 protein, partial [Vallitaleaceae bacterium]|nr:glycoside hydrolase family 88 protein [Vallitaleaceae bacterium]